MDFKTLHGFILKLNHKRIGDIYLFLESKNEHKTDEDIEKLYNYFDKDLPNELKEKSYDYIAKNTVKAILKELIPNTKTIITSKERKLVEDYKITIIE